MVYTVGEMAKLLDVPASTLRYYDKEGLLPFVERSSGGIRMFRESDFEWLQVIGCMKKAGMSIRDIRQYIQLAMQGDDTIDTRLQMFHHQRQVLLDQIREMQHTLETVEYKGTLFPVELEVYDADGQRGILVPNSMEYDAAREIAAGMGTSMGSSINISTDAGAQIASDVGKGVIQGVSQYVEKKMRAVKITLKAGHRLLLHSPEK